MAVYKLFKNKNLYLKGLYSIDKTRINYPTIFEAKGRAIKSGNWERCTSINTCVYIFNHYLNELAQPKVLFDKLTELESAELCELIYILSWDNKKQPKGAKLIEKINRANELIVKMIK